MPVKKRASNQYEIKITLMGLVPAIWRRVQVPCDITLANLHDVIQVAMDWEDAHLHEFMIDKKRYGPASDDPFGFGDDPADEAVVRLDSVATLRTKFIYHYDFGDDWRHEIRIERVIDAALLTSSKRQALCIAGENACPPEDCGGPFTYPNILAVLADPEHEEHGEIMEWLGDDFDPGHFDLAATNHRVSRMKV